MAEGNDLALGYMMGNSDGGNRNGGGMFGGDNSWIFAFLIIAIIFGDRLGLGNGNNGNGGGGNGMSTTFIPYNMGGMGCGGGGAVTRADLCSEFNFNNMNNGVRGIQQGLCDGFYAMNTGMLNGFNNVGNAICSMGYENAQLANGINQNITQARFDNQQCCCDTQRQIERGFCDTNYNLATNTTAIIQNAHNDTDRVIAKLDAMEMNRKDETIAELRAQVQNLSLAASQSNQNAVLMAAMDANKAEILRRTGSECPVAAYVVPNPNCCYGNPVGVSYGYNNGCNNGCCNNNCGYN